MPKWRDVEALVIRYIEQNKLEAGAAIPSDRRFAEQAGCSVQPVFRAMRELEQRGIIQRRAGAATTVAGRPQTVGPFGDFSFRASAERLGQHLENRVIEVNRRLPNRGELEAYEERAQDALGLDRDEQFYVISRLRVLDGTPRAIHRAYLNPAFFPDDFLGSHDFAKGSLPRIYEAHGLEPLSRDATLRARMPLDSDAVMLGIEGEPVLEAEQTMRGVRRDTGEMTNIEYLVAHYAAWVYSISDR